MSAISDDGSIGVYDLKANLSSVLEEVLAGRLVTITRHGRPVAVLQPVQQASAQSRAAAVARLKAARRGRNLGSPARDAVAEGRR